MEEMNDDAVRSSFAGPEVRIVLVRPRNPLNIGAAARAMANFGFDDLVVVQPYVEAWRTARSARAGIAVLERARSADTLEEAIQDCQLVVGTTAGTARTPEEPLSSWPRVASCIPQRARTAVLFGSEKTGLSVEEMSHCRQLARIPTLPDSPSMNLGQAVAVCCYELARQRRIAEFDAPPEIANSIEQGGEHSAHLASIEERERLVRTFHPLLESIGVMLPQHHASQMRRLRQMLLRWRLTPADARLLLGVAREMKRILARSVSGE